MKSIRFQTKLFLAMTVAIGIATFAVLIFVERRVEQSYRDQFAAAFTEQVSHLESSRDERARDHLELSGEIARHPYLVTLLNNGADEEQERDFWLKYLGASRDIQGSGATPQARSEAPAQLPRNRAPSSGPAGGRGPLTDLPGKQSLIAVMNLEGVVTPIEPPWSSKRKGPAVRRPQLDQGAPSQKKADLLAAPNQSRIFLPFETEDRGSFVQETIATPVLDPVSGDRIGLLLRGSSAETSAERFLERYQEEFGGGQTIITGILLDGIFHSRALSSEEIAAAAPAFEEAISHLRLNAESRTNFRLHIKDSPFQAFIAEVMSNGANAPQQVYQVALFSLERLEADLVALRLRGSGVGLFGILLGLAVAGFLARQLSRPLQQLEAGVSAIAEGDYQHRVEVRSRDELGRLSESFNEMADGLEQREHYLELLGKVSDEAVAQAVVSGALDLELGGETKDVTVLFCDIRSFTELAEEMDPTAVIEMLNEHMTAMTATVRENGGVVDKFVGDEIMAVFGALKSYGNDAERASRCALDMIAQRERLNQDSAHPFDIGVGVASGEVVAGCMGSHDRLNYTVLGARVNLAARLCAEALPMTVLIDEETRQRIDTPAITPCENLSLKGFSVAKAAYQLHGLRQDQQLAEMTVET
ncbi:MAG: adenylate/guanylate cyclase domain-containing protein [Verrucomicrobiota bacterium]